MQRVRMVAGAGHGWPGAGGRRALRPDRIGGVEVAVRQARLSGSTGSPPLASRPCPSATVLPPLGAGAGVPFRAGAGPLKRGGAGPLYIAGVGVPYRVGACP